MCGWRINKSPRGLTRGICFQKHCHKPTRSFLSTRYLPPRKIKASKATRDERSSIKHFLKSQLPTVGALITRLVFVFLQVSSFLWRNKLCISSAAVQKRRNYVTNTAPEGICPPQQRLRLNQRVQNSLCFLSCAWISAPQHLILCRERPAELKKKLSAGPCILH